MVSKTFHLREILAIITGLHPGARYFSELQEIHAFVPGKCDTDSLFSREKKDYLLQQFPQLANCAQELTGEELAILKDGSDQLRIQCILSDWLQREVAQHGEYLEVNRDVS